MLFSFCCEIFCVIKKSERTSNKKILEFNSLMVPVTSTFLATLGENLQTIRSITKLTILHLYSLKHTTSVNQLVCNLRPTISTDQHMSINSTNLHMLSTKSIRIIDQHRYSQHNLFSAYTPRFILKHIHRLILLLKCSHTPKANHQL